MIGLIIVGFQNCSGWDPVGEALRAGSEGSADNASDGSNSNSQSVEIFSATLKPLLTQNCAVCHGSIQEPLFAFENSLQSHDTLISSALVNLTDPGQSRLVLKIREGHQNFPMTLADEFQMQIAAWADGISQGGGDVPVAPKLEPKFSSISQLILVPKCIACHGADQSKGGYRYHTYQDTLTSKRSNININNPEASDFYQSVLSGSMPKDAPPLSDEEVQTILRWIQLGALND